MCAPISELPSNISTMVHFPISFIKVIKKPIFKNKNSISLFFFLFNLFNLGGGEATPLLPPSESLNDRGPDQNILQGGLIKPSYINEKRSLLEKNPTPALCKSCLDQTRYINIFMGSRFPCRYQKQNLYIIFLCTGLRNKVQLWIRSISNSVKYHYTSEIGVYIFFSCAQGCERFHLLMHTE